MNIIVKPYGSDLCYCRPDTTWERENKDFYSPECVNEIYWTPVVFARVSKAGKCIGKKFVERYYDGAGCGMLMYCSGQAMISNGPLPTSWAPPPTRGWENAISDHQPIRQLSHIVDKTSILPHPLFLPVVLEDEKAFIVNDTSVILSGAKDLLEESLCKASELTSLRIGDFVAVELQDLQKLASREDGTIEVKGEFCEKEIFCFNIVF
jgi:hypothetical protein